jgi:RHS repeat-associated protein
MSHLGPFIAVLQYGFAVRLQLTQLSSSGVASINYSYNFPTGTNNGKIGSSYNALSGETIAYQYDSLNRLISAAGSGWGDAYGFDGFGNLLSKTVTSGSAPTLSQAVNSANNQIVGQGYDANGNQTSPPNNSGELLYDAENRLTQNSVSVQYAYDSQNKRVWVGTLVSGSLTSQSANLYGIDGQKLGTYSLSVSSTEITDAATSLSVYFAGKRVAIAAAGVTTPFVQDRLGSNMSWAINRVSLYPWGEDRGTPAPNDQIKFATYTRDSATQLDYADQRYYSNVGRFMTPDPGNAGNLRNPQSLNLYSYVLGDPVNLFDPRGLCSVIAGGITQSAYSTESGAEQEFANELGAIMVFPFANGAVAGGFTNLLVQGAGVPTGATATLLNAIGLAAENPGPISLYLYSGSAGTFANLWNDLTPAVQAQIQNITYIDPASFGGLLPIGLPGTNVSLYTDASDTPNLLLRLFGSQPEHFAFVSTGSCGHNANCVYLKYLEELSRTGTDCSIGAGSVFGNSERSYMYGGGLFSGNTFSGWLSDPAPPPVPSITEKITYYQ